MSLPGDPSDDPRAEASRPAAVRDIVAGVVLLALGLVTGGTSLTGRGDGIDVAFDLLGAFWVGWGIWRLLRRGPIKDRDRSDR